MILNVGKMYRFTAQQLPLFAQGKSYAPVAWLESDDMVVILEVDKKGAAMTVLTTTGIVGFVPNIPEYWELV